MKISFRASNVEVAQDALATLTDRYGQVNAEDADVIVALGGDGFMLETLSEARALDKPVYGMNRGTVGFLMNTYNEDNLPERVAEAEEAQLNPLTMRAEGVDGRRRDCASRSMVARVWTSWFAMVPLWRHRRGLLPIIIRLTGQFCQLGRTFLR